jgi:flagellar hook-length control protein FliK
MNAVIATPVDMPTELLAPTATAQGPGRVSAGDFDRLVALLQASLGARPATAAGGGPAPDALAEELPVTGEKPTTMTLARLTLAARTSTRVPSPDGAEALDAGDEDESQGLEPAVTSASLVLAMTPAPVAITPPSPMAPRLDGVRTDVAPETPTTAPSPRSDLAVQAMTRPPAAGVPTPSTPAAIAPTLAAADGSNDAEVAIAAAPEADPRPRSTASARSADAPRGGDGASSEVGSDDAAQRLSAGPASRVLRAAPGREDQPGFQGRESRDGETAPSPSDSAIAGPSAPAASATLRPASDTVASARPEPVRDSVDQIATRLRDVRTDGRHEISLRLDPPDLGTVRIDARLEGTRLQVQIHAERATTGEALADALPRLREALSQQGFVPSEISVHLGLDASGRQFARDSAPTFTPPRDGEPSPQPRVVRAPARAVALSDGLDVWA